MSRSQVLKAGLLSFTLVVASCSTAPEKPYSHEAWAESQHPPSDTEPLPKGCKPLKYTGGLIPIVASTSSSGNYCVVHDFVQRKAVDLIDRSTRRSNPGYGGVLRFFEGSDVDLDLRGHLISGAPFENTVGIGTRGYPLLSDLRVHNGTVVTPGSSGIGILLAPNKFPPLGFPEYMAPEDLPPMRKAKFDANTTNYTHSDPWDYQPATRYIAENLTIQSGGRGIIMSGADNIIRNNTIEVDGHTAVYMYGPRPVIEGNIFIVHLDPEDNAPLPATLKLRDADGAIIRNNRFLVKRGLTTGQRADKAKAAINLLTSKDVLIENNAVEDAGRLVRKDAASTAVERGNQLK